MAWLTMALVLIAGCATTKAFVPPEPPGNGRALVYFIRDHYGMADKEARLYVAGTQVGTIANNDVLAVNVPVGQNSILVDVTGDKVLDFKLPIRRAEKVYVLLSSSDNLAGMHQGYAESTFYVNRHVRMRVITQSEAMDWAARAHKSIS
jgi:hypothetical protein